MSHSAAGQQSRRASVVADLVYRHEEPQRTALRVRDGMHLGV